MIIWSVEWMLYIQCYHVITGEHCICSDCASLQGDNPPYWIVLVLLAMTISPYSNQIRTTLQLNDNKYTRLLIRLPLLLQPTLKFLFSDSLLDHWLRHFSSGGDKVKRWRCVWKSVSSLVSHLIISVKYYHIVHSNKSSIEQYQYVIFRRTCLPTSL